MAIIGICVRFLGCKIPYLCKPFDIIKLLSICFTTSCCKQQKPIQKTHLLHEQCTNFGQSGADLHVHSLPFCQLGPCRPQLLLQASSASYFDHFRSICRFLFAADAEDYYGRLHMRNPGFETEKHLSSMPTQFFSMNIQQQLGISSICFLKPSPVPTTWQFCLLSLF